MSVRPSALLATTVLSAAVLGCGDGLSPARVQGTYVLERVGDDPVPSVIFRDAHATVRILADTLRLGVDGRGRFVRSHVVDIVGDERSPDGPTRLESALSYRIDGPTVEIFYLCPPNARCTAGPHLLGRMSGDRLLVDDALIPEDVRHYRRVESSAPWTPM